MSSFSINVHIDHDLKQLQDYLSGFPAQKEFIILADTNTSHYCLKHLKENFGESNESRIITIPPGEKNKNFDQLQFILSQLAEYGANRNTLLINLGGGVICDMGGFAASIYKRGIQYIHVPTTLLAMVDASIGGKNGIDFNGYKNLIGTITLPENVFISKKFLDTLPPIEKNNGIVEAFKHGLIADKAYWDKIKNDPLYNIEELIATSVKIKSTIVSGDLTEKGDRKKLNAGHTIGHAIEALKLDEDEPVAHGEAVAAGLIAECYISNKLGYLSTEEQAEIEKVLLKVTEKIDLKKSDINDLLKKMRQDKKNTDEKISFSLIRNIGTATINDHCNDELIEEAIQYYIKK